MIFAVVILLIVIILLFIAFMYYRRQVLRLSRQMAFINENRTQMLLTSDINYQEFSLLIREINKRIVEIKALQSEFYRKENEIKEMMANISHDIRTPLTSLDGYFQLLADAKTDEERERYITIIKTRIESLNDMLEELFTYTKLQNEGYEPEFSKINFSKTVFDACFSFYDEFSVKGIEPKIDFSKEQLFINANEEAMRRVIQNVIKNAVVHGAKEVSFSLNRVGERAVFACSNRMSENDNIDLNRIFTRFYKADEARTKSSSGLGLAIAHDFTLKLGGSISAEINEGFFTIRISFDVV